MIVDYLKMLRPLNSFMAGLGVLFAIYVYGGFNPFDPYILVIGFLTGFLGSSSSMLINDYVDRKVDAINKPWKPLPQGRVSPRNVLYLSIALLILGVIINIPIGFSASITALIYIVVGFMYSFLRKYWWSHFIVSFSTTGPIIYGYVLSGMPMDKLGLASLFALTIFFITSGREVLKAIMDVEGDKRYGYSTIPIVFGIGKARIIMVILGVTGSLIGVYIGLAGYANTIYTVTISVAAIIYIYYILTAYKGINDQGVLEKARRNTLYAMLLGLIAFLGSAF